MALVEAAEIILAHGHENIQAAHKTTIEITKVPHLSEEGTCIIAVSADKALADLSLRFKNIMRKKNSKLTVLIEAGRVAEFLNASGSPRLVLTHLTDMVIRKSDYVCSRTLAINADKAAVDLSRAFVVALKDPEQNVKITLTAKV